MRAAAATAEVPVLVLSVTGGDPSAARLEPGASLPKPFAARTFTATVRVLLHPGATT